MSSSSTEFDADSIKQISKNLSGLLGFAQEVLTARSKVQMEMSSGLGVFREQDISELPGTHLDAEDGAWLRLERLRATRPPEPEEYVKAFVSGLPDDPDKRPELLPAISLEVTIDEASELMDAELLRSNSIREVSGDDKTLVERVKVTLHVEDFLAVRQGFENYIAGPWERWSDAEKPVRRAIKLYNALFTLYSAIHSADSTPPELVWGIGIARWKVNGSVVDMPILEQPLDVEVEDGGQIVFRPRAIKPKLSLKPFIEIEVEGSPKLQRALQGSLAKFLEDEVEFSPFDTAWEPLLSTAAAQLTASAEFISREKLNNGVKIPSISDQLVITSNWAIFGRPRSSEAREQDLDSLRQKIEEATEEVPAALRGFASTPPKEKAESFEDFELDSNVLRGGATNSSWEAPVSSLAGDELSQKERRGVHFFPLPFNQEQGRIIDLLEKEDVVSVTGPPGTGKTHSIANIISHMMVRIPANVTGHSGDRDRFAHPSLAGSGFVS